MVRDQDYKYVTTTLELDRVLFELASSKEIALDTETAVGRSEERRKYFNNQYNLLKNGEAAPFDPYTAEVRLVQMKGEETLPIIIDLWKLDEEARAKLATFIENFTGTFLAHNLKFDGKHIANSLGVWLDTNAKVYDTMQASILLANAVSMGKERGHSLANLSRDFLGVDLDKTEQASDWSTRELSDEQLEYAALDVCELHRLRAVMDEALVNQLRMPEAVQSDMDCLMPTARMEYNGVPINLKTYDKVQQAAQYAMPALLGEIGQYFKEEINQPLALTYLDITELDGTKTQKPFMLPWGGGKAGKDFLMSRANLVKGMLLQLGLQDDNGDPLESTEKAVLETYREAYPGIGLLIDYWNLCKQSQFDYRKYTHPKTGRIMARFIAGGASTGRFSSSSPNMQQCSKLSMLHPDGTSISYRHCFEAPPGWLMTSADFSGQEMNIMAAMSGDKTMIDALNNGDDLHGIAGAGAFNVPLDKVREKLPGKEKSPRDYGKILNFSLAYGKTAEGLVA